MKIKLVAIVSAGLFVNACNDDHNHSPIPVSMTSIAGAVIDEAPLSNAKVCFDENNNKSCDDNELSTSTQAEGKYNFDSVPTKLIGKAPLLAEITADTINEFTGLPVNKHYLLRSYSNCTNVINPLTSAVQHFIDIKYTPEDAERKIQNKLKTELPICSNYITQSNNPELSEFDQSEQMHLYQTAVIFHGLMGVNLELLTERFKSEDKNLNHKNMYPVVMHHQINHLDEVINNVEKLKSLQDRTTEGTASSASQISLPIPIPIPVPIPFDDYLDPFGHHGGHTDYQTLTDMQEAMYLMSEMGNSIEINLQEYFYSAPHSVGGLYSYQEREKAPYLAFTARRKNQTVRAGSYDSQRISYPIYRFEQRIWNSRYNQFLVNDQFRSGLDILRDNGFSPVTSQFDRNILLYGKKQDTPDWIRRIISSKVKEQGPFLNQARFVHSRRLDYLADIAEKTEQARLTNDESYLIASKGFFVANARIKNLLALEDNLSMWDQVIKDGARFNNNTAHLMTVRAGNEFALFRPVTCGDGRTCKYVPILDTEQSKITRSGKSPLGDPILYNSNTHDDLDSLIPPSGFSATDLPVLFDDGEEVIYAFLGVGNDAHFFKVPKNESDTYDIYYWILSATNSATGNPVTLPARSETNVMLTQFHRPATWQRQSYKGRDMLVISVPKYVRRAQPHFPSKIALTSDGTGLRFGEYYQQGEIVEDRLALSHIGHDRLLQSVDPNKVDQLTTGEE